MLRGETRWTRAQRRLELPHPHLRGAHLHPRLRRAHHLLQLRPVQGDLGHRRFKGLHYSPSNRPPSVDLRLLFFSAGRISTHLLLSVFLDRPSTAIDVEGTWKQTLQKDIYFSPPSAGREKNAFQCKRTLSEAINFQHCHDAQRRKSATTMAVCARVNRIVKCSETTSRHDKRLRLLFEGAVFLRRELRSLRGTVERSRLLLRGRGDRARKRRRA